MIDTGINVTFNEWKCRVLLGMYVDGKTPALELVDHQDGEPIARASVALPDAVPAEGNVFIKDYSENAGMAALMLSEGIITDLVDVRNSGFVVIGEYRLAPKLWKLIND